MITITRKIENLYFATAVDTGLFSYGNCEDEALNNLTDELVRQGGRPTGRGVELVTKKRRAS